MDIAKEFYSCLARARFLSKRLVNISATRYDGSSCASETDIQATAAEYFAAQKFGCPFNATISSHGDGGFDFSLKLDIEVIWLGIDKRTGKPRKSGHLIVNPEEPQRWADIYVVVSGSIETGFEIIGWTWHKFLIKQPKKDFGYGLKFALPTEKLQTYDLLNFKQ